MSGGRQSYYEIQLSNASLIVAFLLAVAIGVAVFMFGVMVGRRQVTPVDEATPSEGVVEQLGAGGDERAGSLGGDELDFQQQLREPVQEAPGAQPGRPFEASSEPTTTGAAEPSAEASSPSVADDLPAADPSLASGFVIQVKSTPNRSDAENLQAALAGAGFPAFVVSGDVRGRVFYRVRVGRYRTRAEAERVAAVLSRRPEVDETWVTEG